MTREANPCSFEGCSATMAKNPTVLRKNISNALLTLRSIRNKRLTSEWSDRTFFRKACRFAAQYLCPDSGRPHLLKLCLRSRVWMAGCHFTLDQFQSWCIAIYV